MKRKINPPSEIEVNFKEYKQLLGYRTAWKKVRRVLNSDDPRLYFSEAKTNYFNKNLLLERMDEILKQCTQKKKKEDLPSFDDMKGIFRNKKEG